jgi:hypothetical protein
MSRTDPAPFPAVLIVEDDPTIGQHLQLGLQGHGYPTTSPHRRSRPHPRHRSQTQNRFSRPRPSRPRRCRACALRHYGGTHLLRSPPWCGDCRVELILVDPSSRNGAWQAFRDRLPPIWPGHGGSTPDMASVRTALRWCRGDRCSSKLVRSCSGVLFALIEGPEVGPG